MQLRGTTTWMPVAATLLITVGATEALCQKKNQRQGQNRQQQQYMQRALREAAGPAGAFAPNIGTDKPMKGTLWGQGSELNNAMQNAKKQIEAARGNAIPIEQLAQALPPAIGEYIQVELKMPPPPDPSRELTSQSIAPSVSATYQSPSKQTIVVTLTDLGVVMSLMPDRPDSTAGNATQSSDTGDVVLLSKQIQGVDATIYYDRIRETGNLMMNANRVSVAIQGANIPLAMLETSAVEIQVGNLAKLGN